MNNQRWSEKILKEFDPEFKHRWIIFDEMLNDTLNKEIFWIDCGAGNNGNIKKFGHLCKYSVGVDLITADYKENYLKADISLLPFIPQCANLITLRFVAEHFDSTEKYFNELSRVLVKGGKIIILTTNILCPLIFLPKLLFPYSLKSFLIKNIFKVSDQEVFPTYHRINSLDKFREMKCGFKVIQSMFISDINYTNKLMFIFLLIWHLITKPTFLNKFRTNLLVVLEKC
jgi:SAM-dependent methyltransferase